MRICYSAAAPVRTTIRLVAALVVLAAQAGVVGAGVLDAREGASAASHLESGGTNLHFAHNEADCYMCRAQHIGDSAPFSIEPAPSLALHADGIASQPLQIVAAAHYSSNASRAPPAIV